MARRPAAHRPVARVHSHPAGPAAPTATASAAPTASAPASAPVSTASASAARHVPQERAAELDPPVEVKKMSAE